MSSSIVEAYIGPQSSSGGATMTEHLLLCIFTFERHRHAGKRAN